ncbi:MAG: hypothetical protein J6B07_00560 [Opitutales bacterium]|nr:hypothetical protein [Opitutales bacterium]
MNHKRILFIVAICIVAALLIAWLLASIFICDSSSLWKISLKDWVTLVVTIFIGVFVAYILDVRNTRKWQFIDAYVKAIDSLEVKFEKYEQVIHNDYLKIDLHPIVLSFNKNIENEIELLATYSKEMDVFDEISFIKEHFASLKTTTADYTDSLKNEQNRNKATKEIDLILGKLNEMRLKQYAL